MKNIVILGAGYAGMMTALRLSHTTGKRNDVKVTLINASDYFVERIRLHELAVGNPPERHKIIDLLRGSGVEFVQARVKEVNPNSNKILMQTKNGEKEVRYDKLVYALGSMIAKDTIPGIEKHAYTLNTNSAQQLQSRLKQLDSGKRVIVIGGGLTGIEAVTEIAESYPNLRISLLTNGKLGKTLSDKAQDYLQKTFSEMNIDILEGKRAQSIEKEHLLMQDGSAESADVVVWTAGFVVPKLAKESGFAVDKTGRVIVDAYLRSLSHSDVYVAGDAMTYQEHAPLENRMSCQTAMPLGTHVGDNLSRWILGKNDKRFAFGYITQCMSLGQKRGLLQMIHPDDSMKEKIITGRTGAFIKKAILNYTLLSIKLERRFPAYMWIKSIPLQKDTKQQAIAEY